MYYTHGDTIIYRSERPAAEAISTREERRSRRAIRPEPRGAEGVLDRMAQLEARLHRLEERWESLGRSEALSRGEASGRGDTLGRSEPRRGESRRAEPSPPEPRRARRARPEQTPQQVRVSLQAEGGAQATLGEVRMLQHD